MNKTILCGRLCADPEVRYGGQDNSTAVARYSLAVDRVGAKEGQPSADFISCVAFGKSADFAEKYLKKGMKILVEGRIQTGSYTNKEGQKIYTTDVIIDRHEFVESKGNATPAESNDSFVNIPANIDDEIPFI